MILFIVYRVGSRPDQKFKKLIKNPRVQRGFFVRYKFPRTGIEPSRHRTNRRGHRHDDRHSRQDENRQHIFQS